MKTLDEITDSDLTSEKIQLRIDNWVERIDKLYVQMEEWLPTGWIAHKEKDVPMNEPLMKKYRVRAVKLDRLELTGKNNLKATIEPRGLWIIGSNGRLDLVYKNRHYIIVDEAENFKNPQWRIASLSKRTKLEVLNKEKFQSLLK